MIQVIPWERYTYRTYVDRCQVHVDGLEKELSEARNNLNEARDTLDRVIPVGIADNSLPENYGEILLARKVINGTVPREDVADNIQRLVDAMLAAGGECQDEAL